MSIISEVKCARCDRMYSGMRSRCPYCGARRIGSGKFTEGSDSSRGKMIVGILIMSVLVVAVGILLFTAPTPEQVFEEPEDTSEPSSSPDNTLSDNDTISEDGKTVVTQSPPPSDEPEDPTPTPTPAPTVESVDITYSNTIKTDITLQVGERVPLRARVEPAGIELTEKIIWLSSNPSVFDVVADNLEGTSAEITRIGQGTATLTVIAGNVEAECTIRCP